MIDFESFQELISIASDKKGFKITSSYYNSIVVKFYSKKMDFYYISIEKSGVYVLVKDRIGFKCDYQGTLPGALELIKRLID